MKIIPKFQMGGEMTPEAAPEAGAEQIPADGAPAPEAGGEDPIMQIAQMAMQALQSQDCNAAMSVCQIFLQMIQQAQGGGAPEPQGEPVFKKGGRLVRRNKK